MRNESGYAAEPSRRQVVRGGLSRANLRWLLMSGVVLTLGALWRPWPRQAGVVAGLALTLTAVVLLRRQRGDNPASNTTPSGPDRGGARAEARAVQSALGVGGFEIHFQPIVWLPTADVVGYEGLARFPAPPERPDQWLVLAERCGLRVEVEVAAVRKGLAALRAIPSDCYVSLNVSPDTLLSDALLEVLTDYPCDRVVLELTEHRPIADYDAHLPRIATLRGLGIRLAVDDAGAGYSSLRHILILRPDIIKLDRTLTAGVKDDPVRRALLTCLATFAHATRTTLIAEGIETADELAALMSYGIAFGQGYYFRRPAPLDSLPVELAPVGAPSSIRLP